MKSSLGKLLVGLALVGSTQALATPPELSGLDEFMEKALATSHVPGAAVAVVKGQEVVLAKGYGVREAGSFAPVDADTVFAIGSNSKYFTGTALGMLVEEGKVDWDAPLTTYLPQLRFSSSYLYNDITVRDSLTHRSGLARADRRWYANPGADRQEILDMIADLPQEIPLRSGFLYNNFMYAAAGAVIPAVAWQTWDEFVSERIFKPLKMKRSRTSWQDLQRQENVASPHTVIGDEAIRVPYANIDQVGAAGSITSSVNDMSNWCKVQLADGKWGDKQVIPEAVIKDVRTPQNLASLRPKGHFGNKHASYGMGIGRGNYGDAVGYWHTGGIDGMLSVVMFIPSEQLCVVGLTNGSPNASLHTLIAGYVLDNMLDLPGMDHLEQVSKAYEMTIDNFRKAQEAHAATADRTVKPTLAADKLANTYHSDVFGELVISEEAGELRFSYGKVFKGRLQHHRGDVYNLVLDNEVRRRTEKSTVSFSASASGDSESLVWQDVGQEQGFRYIAAPRPEPEQEEE